MSVERVDLPLSLEDFYFHYHTRRRPVVIRTGSLAQLGWKTQPWNNEYLAQKAGAQQVWCRARRGRV